ncbi:Bax inhibitor-1/YccA family protein [Desulfatitalea tepidiphila]|uniref:Bax inhibitor-1/YccA family protein n=1 Tax=Desulfatitalea tepidiphila TaxID=1185843 RepID=UPI0006B45F3D|nr:Bax inhibitor-1/YccA family protein [Desulfatitalea tepidiphila]
MQPQPYSMSQTQVQARVNEFVRGVYNWMALGLALTGVVAYFVTHNEPALKFVYQARWLFFIGELALVFIISARIQKIQASTATGMFMAYSALNGATLALLLIMFTGETIASTFFICAAMFLALSIYGWTTKRDLTGLGSFLFMGVIGILIASVVNIFIGSYGMQMIISYIGVLVFAGLTAYDTQQIKAMALSQPAGLNAGAVRKGAIIGALKLYLDFILMFQYLLMILGGNRR